VTSAWLGAYLGGLLAVAPASAPPEGKKLEPLVEVSFAVPDAVVDLRYATADNFMRRRVYPTASRCLLLAPAAARLAQASERLRAVGFRLKVYDAYRPLSVQWELWKVAPRVGFVANPRTGSHHNRGAAVDVTLVTLDGGTVEMPTDYDAFTKAAHHAYAGGTERSRRHRGVLRQAMEAEGFRRNPMEWWHYELPDAVHFPLRDEPLDVAPAPRP
jgi:D-alanyl-D-alanine dipeptidase